MGKRSRGLNLWSRAGRGVSADSEHDDGPRDRSRSARLRHTADGGADTATVDDAGPVPPSIATAAELAEPAQLVGANRAPAYRRRVPGRPGSAQAAEQLTLDGILRQRAVHMEYQAVVDVVHGQVVGYEALARGPDGPLHSPGRLFAAARAAGRVGELDWICRAAAFTDLMAAQLHASISLFVNVEPDSLVEPCPDDLLETIWEAETKLRVFIDISGRALARYPTEVLESVRRARAAEWGVAVNDMELSAAGLALLPVLEPDVVKLDSGMLASGVGHAGVALTAALAEAERGGGVLLVDKVEDERASAMARAVDATYQQGRRLAREGSLAARLPTPVAPLPLINRTHSHEHATTPWSLLTSRGARCSTNVPPAGLDYLFLTVARQAGEADLAPVIAVLTQRGGNTPPELITTYRLLVERSPLIVILGTDVNGWSDWRVRAGDLPADHPFTNEVCFVALSSAAAMVVSGREISHPDAAEARWDIAISQEPGLCRQVVHLILDTLDTLAGGIRYEPDQPTDNPA